MSRRLALAWSLGCWAGLAVGFVTGAAVRDLAAFRSLRGPARRSDGLNGSERADGRGHDSAALTAAIPAQRTDEVDPNADCPITLGPLTCPFRGPHTSHAFQSGTWAPDRKDDADERIE